MKVLAEATWDDTYTWQFIDNEDGTYKVTKNDTQIQTGSDYDTIQAYWNDLNEQMIQPGFTP
jgi:hypothetical protein